MNETALTIVKDAAPAVQSAPAAVSIWDDAQAMGQAVRMAEYLAQANVIPQQYRRNPGDCLVAIDLGRRMRLSPVVVMQNSQIVYGNFSWKGSACKAMIDGCGKFRNSRYEFCGEAGSPDWGCRIVAENARTNETVCGPWVTMRIAKDEGWLDRKDKDGKLTSKWRTMPELMLRYRAASFFAKAECPEVLMGFQTAEEEMDIHSEINSAPDTVTRQETERLDAINAMLTETGNAPDDKESDDAKEAPEPPDAAGGAFNAGVDDIPLPWDDDQMVMEGASDGTDKG